MRNPFLKIAAAGLLMLAPAVAEAAEGYATANVNMRAGPSTQYPAVTVIPAGESVEIHGCLADVPWCDVEFYGGRGWVAGRYVQAIYQQRRVYVDPQYYRPLGIPTVVFSVGNYWDRYYRDRDFYRDRDRWRRGPDFSRDRDRDREWDRDRDRNRRVEFDRGPDRQVEEDRRPPRRPDFDRDRDRDQGRERVRPPVNEAERQPRQIERQPRSDDNNDRLHKGRGSFACRAGYMTCDK
ncbi:SH3 domain-containing protein [Rhizobium binxianense]